MNAPVRPERSVIGTVLEASPRDLVVGEDSSGPERRFALTDSTRVWRGGRVPPTATGEVLSREPLPLSAAF